MYGASVFLQTDTGADATVSREAGYVPRGRDRRDGPKRDGSSCSSYYRDLEATAALTHKSLKDLAGPTRIELATSCVTGRRSNRLNYGPAFLNDAWLMVGSE